MAHVQKFMSGHRDRLSEAAKNSIFPRTRILRPDWTSQSPRGMVKTQIVERQPTFLFQWVWDGSQSAFLTSSQDSGDAAGPWTTLGEPFV